MNKGDVVQRITQMTDDATTLEDLQKMLHEIAFAIGGMVCQFNKEDRSQLVMELTQSLGMGLMLTSKSIGQPSDIEVVVGHKPL